MVVLIRKSIHKAAAKLTDGGDNGIFSIRLAGMKNKGKNNRKQLL